MRLNNWLVAAALCLTSLGSQASVIYEWRALDNGFPRNVTIRLEFTEETVKSGAFEFHSVQLGDRGPLYPDSGLLSIYLTTLGNAPISYHPRTELLHLGDGILELALKFENGGFLTGDIYVSDLDSHFLLKSQGRVFEILDANSFQGMTGAGCDEVGFENCRGAKGHLRRNDIPEPGSLALLAIGLTAAAGFRRRARP